MRQATGTVFQVYHKALQRGSRGEGGGRRGGGGGPAAPKPVPELSAEELTGLTKEPPGHAQRRCFLRPPPVS
ncbi:hypothetical protein GCM10017687_88020 [Streptomyces echinatus]